MSLAIDTDSVGIIAFSMTNAEGAVLEEVPSSDPIPYLHGHGHLMPGLERALTGKVAGDRFAVTLAPADAFGEVREVESIRVHRREFPKDMELEVGMHIPLEDENGVTVVAFVEALKGAWVTLSPNHPLAGQTLTFNVEVMDVRQATPEELLHGHPHGIDGHGHHHDH